MNFCPDCGKKVKGILTVKNVATEHYTFICGNGHKWEETVLDSGETLNISPVSPDQENNARFEEEGL